MSEAKAHDAKKEVRTYLFVFVSLAVLTWVTVWVASIEFTVAMGVFVALIIATFKGSLVASFFMHLLHEKKWVLYTLVLTMFFFIVLIGLPLFALMDQQGVDVP